MEFIFFCILRSYFVKLHYTPNEILITKGLLFRRIYAIPYSAITMMEVKRSLPLRLVKAKRVTLYTLRGRASFYMHRNDTIPLCHPTTTHTIKAKASSIIFGAFNDTRALSGTVIFAIAIIRLGQLSDDYYRRVISALLVTAEEMEKLLRLFNVTIPQATVFAAVFVGVAWIFALIRKLLRLWKFRINISQKFVTVRHGLITLYEYTLVRNNSLPVARCDTLSTLVTQISPLYCGKIMLFPPINRFAEQRLLTMLFRAQLTAAKSVQPPTKAIFGHCATPLAWLTVFIIAAIALWITENFGLIGHTSLLRSILWTAAAVSLWYTITYGIYCLHSSVGLGTISHITHRRGARLYTVYIPDNMYAFNQRIINPLQQISGMCDLVIACAPQKLFKLRNLEQTTINKLSKRNHKTL